MNAPLLSCTGMTRRFGGLLALDQLDLDVQRGEVLGLLGPNGSGKTTFFNVLTGIYPYTAGSALLEGHAIENYSPAAIYRAGIARTFQRSRIYLPLSLFDNIMIGNLGRADTGLWHNLFRRRAFRSDLLDHVAKVRDLAATFNATLADRIFEAAGNFPMLDRRRIEICRALIGRPRLLLLDEPSAGMTHDETHQLMDDILSVRDRTPALAIIIIEHEMSVIERATDRCVVLNFGQKISSGTYREVVADRQVRQAYLGVE